MLRVLHDALLPRRSDAAAAPRPLRRAARLRGGGAHRGPRREAVAAGAPATVTGERLGAELRLLAARAAARGARGAGRTASARALLGPSFAARPALSRRGRRLRRRRPAPTSPRSPPPLQRRGARAARRAAAGARVPGRRGGGGRGGGHRPRAAGAGAGRGRAPVASTRAAAGAAGGGGDRGARSAWGRRARSRHGSPRAAIAGSRSRARTSSPPACAAPRWVRARRRPRRAARRAGGLRREAQLAAALAAAAARPRGLPRVGGILPVPDPPPPAAVPLGAGHVAGELDGDRVLLHQARRRVGRAVRLAEPRPLRPTTPRRRREPRAARRRRGVPPGGSSTAARFTARRCGADGAAFGRPAGRGPGRAGDRAVRGGRARLHRRLPAGRARRPRRGGDAPRGLARARRRHPRRGPAGAAGGRRRGTGDGGDRPGARAAAATRWGRRCTPPSRPTTPAAGARSLALEAVARDQLEAAGVAAVHDTGLCTMCADPALFFSHRRDGGVTGRQAGVAWRG